MRLPVVCLYSAVLATSYLPPALLAEEPSMELEKTLVTANRMAKPASAIPNTVSIIDAEMLIQQAIIDDSVAGILEKTVPGFAPSSQKMTGGAETLRGKNPLYMLDGVPQHNSLRDGLRDGFTIDSDFLERIEVVQGANAIQGIGATGGVVNLITKQAKGTGEWNNQINYRFTTNDGLDNDAFGHKLSYIGDTRRQQFDLVTGVALHQRGVFFDANGDRVGFRTAQGELQDSDSRDLFLKGGLNWGQQQRLQLMLNDYELENNGNLIPITGDREAGIYATTETGDSSADIGDPAKNEVTSLSLDYSHGDLFGGQFKSQLYWQDYAALFEGSVSSRWQLTPDGAAILDQSEIQSEKMGLKLSYEVADLAGVSGLRSLYGFDYTSDESTQVLARTGRAWVPEMTLASAAPFVQLDYRLTTQLLLAAGLRYESAELEVNDFTTLPSYDNTQVEGGTPSYDETLTNLGVVYQLTEHLALYASYAEGFDMPDVGRVLRSIDTAGLSVEDIIDLEPVITENTEVGININSARWQAQLSIYQSKTDLGSRLEADNAGIYEVRREKQEIQGYDLIVSYLASNSLLIGANYAHLDGEYDSDEDGDTDTDLSNTNLAPNRLNLFTQLDQGAFTGKLQVSQLFDRTQKGEDAFTDNRKEFAGYTLLDLSLAYASAVGNWGLGIENLLDEDYETLYSQTQNRDDRYFSGRGRTLSVSYRGEF